MNYSDIVNKGELVYASKPSDKKLRRWQFDNTKCIIRFYETQPLSIAESIILKLINSCKGYCIPLETIGLRLGFDICEKNFEGTKFYKDDAEINLFKSFFKSAFDNYLISTYKEKVEEEIIEFVKLTKLGHLALERNCKFLFFKGTIEVMTNMTDISQEKKEKVYFPFKKSLGISQPIVNRESISDINPDEIDIDNKDELIRIIELQNDVNQNIFYAEKTYKFSFPQVYVDLRLYRYESIYYPLVFIDDKISELASDLLNHPKNIIWKEHKIKRGLYCKLINNEGATINYHEIIPFIDEIDKDDFSLIVQDKRTDWRDPFLFRYIANDDMCDTDNWRVLSKNCPIDIIEKNIIEYKEQFNWGILSSRMPIEYIAENLSYPWFLKLVLERPEMEKKYAQKIMISSSQEFFEWKNVEKYIDIDFIKNNISSLNISFIRLSEWLPTSELKLALHNHDKGWDWTLISKRIPLIDILEGINIYVSYLDKNVLLDRICTTPEYRDCFIFNNDFKKIISRFVDSTEIGSYNLASKKNYIWDDSLISFFESTGILKWNSNKYILGFCRFNYVEWDDLFFEKYHNKITSQDDLDYLSQITNSLERVEKYLDFPWNWNILATNDYFRGNEIFLDHFVDKISLTDWLSSSGRFCDYTFFHKYHDKFISQFDYSFISNRITDKKIVFDYPNFNWDWSILSRNRNLINDQLFIEEFKDQLQILAWIDYADSKTIETNFDYLGIPAIAKENNLWDKLTRKLSPQFILNKINLDWDKSILTDKILSKLYSDERLLIDYADKWDWKIINNRLWSSFNFSISILLSPHIKQYINWYDLSRYLPIDKIKSLLEYEVEKWDWDTLANRLEPSYLLNNLIKYSNYWDIFLVIKDHISGSLILEDDNLHLIKDQIMTLSPDSQKKCWHIITCKYSPSELLSLAEIENPTSGIYWDYSRVYSELMNLEDYLSNSHSYIDWFELSASKASEKYLSFNSKLFERRTWRISIKNKLNNEHIKWDYKGLTRLKTVQREYKTFLGINPNKWDWDFISEFYSCFISDNNGEANLRKYKDFVNFSVLSKRSDIDFSETLLSQFIDENWDWSTLSANNRSKFSLDFVFKNIDKAWDWNSLSKNSSIIWNNGKFRVCMKNPKIVDAISWTDLVKRHDLTFDDDIVELIYNCPISWTYLSSNPQFVPSVKNITLADNKGELNNLDWLAISRNKRTEFEVLEKYTNLLNWEIVTQNEHFNINDNNFLDKFVNLLDWKAISQRAILNTDFLKKYKEHLCWEIINERFEYTNLTFVDIEYIADKLDWEKLSQTTFRFSEEAVRHFINYWSWDYLSKNPSFESCGLIDKFTDKVNPIRFIDRLREADTVHHYEKIRFGEFASSEAYSSLKIYHFTHLFNSIDVIKNRKILSRDKAEELGLLKFDSAGSVIGRTSKAHPYARFYFRPKSLTQFYNECLGWDKNQITNWGASYYDRAKGLGMPRCPLPVFFEFDLLEVIKKMPEICYYSDGNMQTNNAQIYKITNNPNGLNTEFLYKDFSDAFAMTCISGWNRLMLGVNQEKIRHYSQQEFLVKGEFDFSNMKSFRICCYDDFHVKLLRDILADDPIVERIVVCQDLFNYENRHLSFKDNNDYFSISSNYDPESGVYLLIKGNPEIINNEQVIRTTPEGIVMYPRVLFKKGKEPDEVYFIDNDRYTRTKKWLIYSHNNSSVQSNKMEIKEELISCIKDFVPTMSNLNLKLDKALFYPEMLNSYHGIAHTARVLFATHLIVSFMTSLSQEEKFACYYAAIIHDLGKRNDYEGKEHGYNSMILWQDKLKRLIPMDYLWSKTLDAIRYHSVEDYECPLDTRNSIIWKVLKDADALDRSRFSGKGCDSSYLRLPIFSTDIGEEIINLTRFLPSWSSKLEWKESYLELYNCIKKYLNIE